MERVVLHSEIIPGATEDYIREHAVIPDDLARTFSRIGIHNWTIWRSGHRLFHLVECDDFAAAQAELDTDEANARWQEKIGTLVASFYDSDGHPQYAPLQKVWDLETQVAGDQSGSSR